MSVPEPLFPQFQSLPVEIRLMIWSLHHGRIIEIYPVKDRFAARPTSAPALLHVNRELRAYARRSYDIVDLAPRARSEDRDQVGVLKTDSEELGERFIMIDLGKDTLFLMDNHFEYQCALSAVPMPQLSRVPALRKVQHFAILFDRIRLMEDLCRAMPMLQSITLDVYGEAVPSTAL